MLDTLQFIQNDFPWFFQTFAFIFGALVGSFLNVCIYRIPAERSVITPGSTCACGKPIAWYDNIPIFSWFILRGEARCCGSPYSFRYPAIELLTALLFLAAWVTHSPLKAAALMVMISMLLCATFIDFDHMEIPNRFSVGLAIVGFAFSVMIPELHLANPDAYAFATFQSGYVSVIGTLVGSGTILWIGLIAETILRKEAMGFGDVKLLGGIGAFLGWQGALFSIFGGAAIGSVGILIWAIIRKLFNQKSENDDGSLIGRQVPFGPMLASGALLYALLMESSVDSYFAQAAQLLMLR